MYNLEEYIDNYSKISERLWKYCRDEPFLDVNNAIAYFPAANNNSVLFKFKKKITSKTAGGGTKDVKIMFPLKYLSKFWRTIEMSLINCEINFILTWSNKVC